MNVNVIWNKINFRCQIYLPIKRYVFKKLTECKKVYVWKILPLLFELGQCPLSKDEFAANTIILQNQFIITMIFYHIWI